MGHVVVTVRPTSPNNATKAPTAKTSAASSVSEQFRNVVRNGYTYQIDHGGRTRRVSGALTVSDAPRRSRASQMGAGGVDRRTSDDGGHYIAARVNGPTEAFNHFAQDKNFNRGDYRALEDQWAKAKRAGKSVTVTIVPAFDGTSRRPAMINVRFTIDGQVQSKRFPNTSKEKTRGK